MDVHMFTTWSIRLMFVLAMPCLATIALGQQNEFSTPAEASTFDHPEIGNPFDSLEGIGQAALDHPLMFDYVMDEGGPTVPYHFTFTPKFLVGPVYGFIQAPVANAAHTSSHQRPRLSELGIGDALIPDLELAASRGPHEVYAGIQIIRLTGTETVRQNLTTDGVTYPKGKRIRSDVNLDWYRLGYRYAIPLFQGEDGIPRLTITPAAELVWWTFEYRIKGGNGTTSTGAPKPPIEAKRSYDRFTGRGGASIEWRPYGGPFSVEGKAMADPKVDGIPFVATEEFMLKYRMLQSNRYGLTVHTGVVFQQMDYNDGRDPRANHVKADFGPLWEIGLNVNF